MNSIKLIKGMVARAFFHFKLKVVFLEKMFRTFKNIPLVKMKQIIFSYILFSKTAAALY